MEKILKNLQLHFIQTPICGEMCISPSGEILNLTEYTKKEAFELKIKLRELGFIGIDTKEGYAQRSARMTDAQKQTILRIKEYFPLTKGGVLSEEEINFYDTFVNSKDIANYWKAKNVFLKPTEKAYIIWHNSTQSAGVKFKAWEELIALEGDYPIKNKKLTAKNIEELLNAYLQIKDKCENWLDKREYEKLPRYFDDMWFAMPTPFRKGDVVCATDKQNEPFVLSGICTWKEYSQFKFQDSTEMWARGYFVDEKGQLYENFVDNYLDLNYFRGELDGRYATLNEKSKELKNLASIV